MLEHLKPGSRIKAIGPAGQFSYLDSPDAKYLFISAGSGITPLMSMTTFMFDLGDAPDIVFINCARRPSEIIFRERLEHMASRVPSIDLKWVVSGPDAYHPWTGYQGHFNQLMLGLMAPDYLLRDVYCCGPEPFMQTVRDALSGLGYDMSRYHQESFLVPAETKADVPKIEDVVPEASGAAIIRFAASGRTVDCAQTDTILSISRREGLPS